MTNTLIRTLFLSLLLATASADASDSQQLRFRVMLDDNEIGYHTYDIRQDGEGVEVRSEASFDVRFLFITAYRYRHSNTELWRGDCLSGIESSTNANGKMTEIEGSRSGDEFVLVSESGTRTIEECVSTFAYWDRSFMDRGQLLNPQTGEYMRVEVEILEPRALEIRGKQVSARRYRITSETVRLDLWYSEDDEWLALESPAKGGRLLRYELT